MEIGSYIEIQFSKGAELYKGEKDIARLNSGRAAIYHAARVLGVKKVYLPYYQCDTVRAFLKKKGVELGFYHIDRKFNIIDNGLMQETISTGNAAILIVNYYGIMSYTRLKELTYPYKNVIIDNCQAFYSDPLETDLEHFIINVYSARKFVGVPDGAYVIGSNADRYTEKYPQDYSSNTSLFLLQRIEYGCEGIAYESRMLNENRIDSSDIMKMSKLTRAILDGITYDEIQDIRRKNFELACSLFDCINKIDVKNYYDESCIPMIYPLVIEQDTLLPKLLSAKHFQGHWWSYLLKEMETDSFEYWMSRYMIPITIDQRYGEEELYYIKGVVQ